MKDPLIHAPCQVVDLGPPLQLIDQDDLLRLEPIAVPRRCHREGNHAENERESHQQILLRHRDMGVAEPHGNQLDDRCCAAASPRTGSRPSRQFITGTTPKSSSGLARPPSRCADQVATGPAMSDHDSEKADPPHPPGHPARQHQPGTGPRQAG